MTRGILVLLMCQFCWLVSVSQADVDPLYIRSFKLPNVVKFSLEKTGAGLEVSPDHTLTPPSASFPFNTGINAGVQLSYKFLNLSVSQSLQRKTNNRSFVVALNSYNGLHNFGGKLGFYSNVAALQDNTALDTRSSINLVKFSPYWLIHPNSRRLSLAAITDYSRQQLRSAGSFLFEVNPFYLRSQGKDEFIIPADQKYQLLFEELSGLRKLSIINLDFRVGYVYTKTFTERKYFLSGGLFLGPGFGFHHAKTIHTNHSGMHWQSSLRMFASAGYHAEDYFIAGGFRYTNSFTPVSSIGVLAEEGSLMITFGLRFKALENRIPDRLNELWR